MTSIIIPAHNEASGIARSVRSVLDQAPDAEIVVVANDCRDDTADRARDISRDVQVLETDSGGKCLAMNLGDEVATSFPRFYMDADVRLTAGSIPLLEQALEDGRLLVAPEPRVDITRSSLPARLVLQIQQKNGFYGGRAAPNGSGVFGVSEAGRSRWDRFPIVLNDDGFVGLMFAGSETTVVPGAVSIVEPPRTFRAMIGPRARSVRGNWQLEERYPQQYRERLGGIGRDISRRVARDPRLWAGGVAYGTLRVLARIRAWRERETGLWNQDRSTRL